MIIGCGGSGKSTLAAKLGVCLTLPVFHLDKYFWNPGWVQTPRPEWNTFQEDLIKQPSWIIDGNYGSSLDLRISAADTIIFLDLPTLACLWNVVKRFLKYRGTSRPDMCEGCSEALDGEFVAWILKYRKKERPQVLSKLAQAEQTKKVVVLSSFKAMDEFLESCLVLKHD
ncbi:MAG: DNA topology modulation protein [Anaerolineaceae bacterium]|nr:DNA topology modulation protein [Anaerolineaceae bacterium]